MAFPRERLRRLRRTERLRSLVRETTLDAQDLVLPLFVDPGLRAPEPIASMPGIERLSIDLAALDDLGGDGLDRAVAQGACGVGDGFEVAYEIGQAAFTVSQAFGSGSHQSFSPENGGLARPPKRADAPLST